MLYPASGKKITVDQSKVLQNRLFRSFWATRYNIKVSNVIIVLLKMIIISVQIG